MKKKIIITLVGISLIFLAGGIYIITTIEKSTSTLDRLIMLHQVEILREHLLLQIKQVQADLNLYNTPNARGIDTIITNVKQMDMVTATCFDCHHAPVVMRRLDGLTQQIESFKDAFSSYLTIRSNQERVQKEVNTAFNISERLLADVGNMVHMAANKLSKQTQFSLKNITNTKVILYMLVAITPFFAAGLGFIIIRELTKPVKALLTATRELKGGNLDYRVEGLKDEYAEVARSLNEMAASLKQSMLEIQEKDKLYRVLFESAGDAICLIEAEGENTGDIVDANPATAIMHGYTIDELLNLNLIKDLDAPDAAEEAPDRVRRMMDGEWIKEEINHIRKDGSLFPVEINAGLLEFMGHKYILAIDRDISERKEMENQILKSKLDWEDTFNTITDMITIHDKDFNIIRANKTAIDTLDLSFPENTTAKCYKIFHGKDRPPDNCLSCECLTSKEPASFELFEPHLDRFLEVRAMPRFDDDHQVTGVIHVIRDITERKKVEGVLQRAEQMKLIGEWAAGLAHEIKNPLAGIKVSVEVLLEDLNISAEDRAIVLRAVGEIQRIEALLKSLLRFAKPPKLQLTVVDMNDLLDQTIDFSLRHPALSSDSSIILNVSKDLDKNIPMMPADPIQLQQVFLNLLFNAIEAMPNGGELGIKSIHDKNANTTTIEISDTGQGIDKDTIDDVFKPFFTTKSKGTGLGLAITRRIVEEHDGVISVTSDPGKETVFKILLNINKDKKEALI
ncbi:MAG: PAS domain S-box protein [Desulfobacterales bacterium]|nr:PAS domain S-box protein [Desulfobacterales bacterium]